MNCDDIKNLIFADYLDDELSAAKRHEIEEHLASCQHCRKLAEELRRETVDPFGKLEQKNPSQDVWARIKESIEERPQGFGWEDMLGKVKNIFFPKPVLVLSTVVAFLFFIVVGVRLLSNRQQIVKNEADSYLAEQIEYLVFLDENGSSEEEESYQTDLEKIFL